MKYIHEAEDFGLAINCMSRLYLHQYDEKILDDLLFTLDKYIQYLSLRTIICSIRDLLEENQFWGNDGGIPTEQEEKYQKALKILVQYGLTLDKKDSDTKREDARILNFGRDTYFITHNSCKKGWTEETFLKWVKDNQLNEEVDCIELDDRYGDLPLKTGFKECFFRVCFYMLRYSYGRHTYMPSACRSFIKDNIELINDRNLDKLIGYLFKKNSDIPENEPDIYKMDSDTWLLMQAELEDEKIARKVYKLAKEAYHVRGRIKKMIRTYADFTTINNQEDCLRAYYQLDGIKRYLRCNHREESRDKLSQIEKAQKSIAKLRIEYWEQEEGGQYEKIREGVYIKRMMND